MIASALRQLCGLSILCGAAMSIAPEGSVKRMLAVVCSVALILAAAQPLAGLDLTAYALELAKAQDREEAFLDENSDINDRLNRLVIEQRLEEYIEDKAARAGLQVRRLRLTVQWSTEGLWVPYALEIECGGSGEAKEEMRGALEAELGIPAERQQWSGDGATEDEAGEAGEIQVSAAGADPGPGADAPALGREPDGERLGPG